VVGLKFPTFEYLAESVTSNYSELVADNFLSTDHDDKLRDELIV
jgi:hypothetical protein